MTLKVEDGTGVSGANSYVTAAEVTTYLTDRARQTENSWSTADSATQDAACVAASDYVEQRWGQRFKGRRQFQDISAGRSTLTFTDQPADTDTVTIGSTVYTFNTSLGGAYSVLIGDAVEDTIDNLVNAIAAVAAEAGVTHGSGTVIHPDVGATAGVGDTMYVDANEKGTAGNGITTTETSSNASWSSATLIGGGDVVTPQPMSFPRSNLYDREGLLVAGIPAKLKQAVYEYAVRAVSSTITLMPDPEYDDTGKAVIGKKEKVGPIETDLKFEEGGSMSNMIRAYPAADRLLTDYVRAGGRVIRG